MKQADKFLLAIVIGVLLLVAVAFALVLLQPEPQYRDGLTAEDVVHNYLLALQQGAYERALEQIAKEVPNRPQDAAEMEWDISQNKWRFERYGSPALDISGSRVAGDNATITIDETRSEMPLFGNTTTEEITMRLKKEDGKWKIIEGEAYWVHEWQDE